MKQLLSTKEVAQFIGVNEKMVYTLISEKRLPATKITGKWLFPSHLVLQWIETHTTNYPEAKGEMPPYEGLLIVAGSNDLLLDKAISLFNSLYPEHIAVFGNLGSMGGLRALRRNLCHIATSHLMQAEGDDYNFDFAVKELEKMPAVVNFCRREQGILIQKGNPKGIRSVEDLAKPGITIVNRALGTGTRLLLDLELRKAGIPGDKIEGYRHEVQRHLDVGLEILADRADAGPGIRAVAQILGLDFISLLWERYDFMISKQRFFDEGVQRFLGVLHEESFREIASASPGYDFQLCGKMVFPGNHTKGTAA